MTLLRIIDMWVLVLWLTIDSIVLLSRRVRGVRGADRFSTLAIVVANWTGIWLASWLGFAGIAGMGARTAPMQVCGLAVFVTGIVIRSVAISQLGKFHTANVAIQVGHKVVDTGLYRRVRHPSYLGASIALAGFGLGLGSWMSAVAAPAIALIAYSYRIHVEEKALLASLGDAYLDYRKRTRRLIPWVY